MNIFSPKGFLRIAGVIFILLGFLGFIGILGDSPSRSIFGSSWWFTNAESLTLFAAGVISLFISSFLPPLWQRYIVILVGIFSVIMGLYVFSGADFFWMDLQTLDSAFYLVFGLWALYAVYGNLKGGGKK
jgi:hypothetical protein